MLEIAKDVRDNISGAEHEATLDCLILLSMILSASGFREKAESTMIRAKRLTAKSVGMIHPKTISCNGMLAVNYVDQCRHEEAEDLIPG